MTGNDVSRIESALQITLPAAYRELLSSAPVPAHAGNSGTAFWDDADRLIEGLAEDLTGEGGDPSGTPQQREAVEEQNARASARFSAWLVVAVVIAVAALFAWTSLR